MIIRTKRIIILIFFSLAAILLALAAFSSSAGANGKSESPPAASEGILNLDEWRFAEQGAVSLDGKWAFYPETLWSPDQSTSPGVSPLWISVPGTWGIQTIPGKKLHNQSYGTYRLHIRMNEQEAKTVKALYMPSVATAYKLWVNGIVTAGNGQVGSDKKHMVPKNYSKVVLLPPSGKDLDVVLQVSNFVQRKGGLWAPIRFGNADQMLRAREHNVSVQLLFIISNFVLFVYHVSLYIFRRSDKASLYLSLFCVMLALRTLLLQDTLLISWFPGIPWDIAVKFEYLAAYAALTLFPQFIAQLYPQEINHKVTRVFLVNGIVFAIPVIVFPADIFTQTLIYFEAVAIMSFPYLLYVLVRAAHKQREGAGVSLLAGILLLITVLNDILYYNEIIDSLETASYGMLLFVFVQTLIIVYRFSRAYQKSELLSLELQSLNVTLEEKVQDRTKELERSYSDLQEANESLQHMVSARRHLLSNISHELGTPMTIILGNVNAVMDGLVPKEQQKKYMQNIHNKIFIMQRIIRDLFDLSKLEAKQIKFTYVKTPAEQLIEHAAALNEMDLQGDGIDFNNQDIKCIPEGSRCYVYIDSIRIQQVFTNLIQNALNFTPSGGKIEIGGEWSPETNEVRYYVRDTGKGIAAASLPHIFDRYFQDGHNRPPGAGGSGLGLAIVREIVEQHAGKIGVLSEEGVGTTVYFNIPAELKAI